MDLFVLLQIISLPLLAMGLLAAVLIKLDRSDLPKRRVMAVLPWLYLGLAALGVPRILHELEPDPGHTGLSLVGAMWLPVFNLVLAAYLFRLRREGKLPARQGAAAN